MEIAIIMIIVLLSGFFSGSEIAFVSASRIKMEIESRKASPVGRALHYFMQNGHEFLSTTLIGNNIINVLYATLMAIFLEGPLITLYEGWQGVEPNPFLLLLTQTIIASVVIMIFGEIVPKTIFRSQADTVVRIVALPFRGLLYLFRPMVWIATVASEGLIRLFGITQTPDETQVFRRQEMESLFQELRESGGGEDFDEDDSEFLHNVLDLSNKRVKELMVPRTEIIAVDDQTTISDVEQTFISSGYSKLPVYHETIDDVIGVVFLHSMYDEPKSLKDILRPVSLIPQSKRAQDLLNEFRKTNTSIALVIDEYGGTAGLITAEDLIEEVVGDIQDEYDTEDEFIKKLNDSTYVLSGNVELEDLLEQFPDIGIPFGDDTPYDTVAGYIIHESGRIPNVNEELIIGVHKVIISKASPSRIKTVRLERLGGDLA